MTDYPSVKWTGENVDEVEDLAIRSEGQWGFTIGSPYHNYRWYHRVVTKVVFDNLYPLVQPFWGKLSVKTRSRIIDGWEPKEDPTVLEVLYLDSPRRGWTTLLVGDRIYLDGSIIRGEKGLKARK